MHHTPATASTMQGCNTAQGQGAQQAPPPQHAMHHTTRTHAGLGSARAVAVRQYEYVLIGCYTGDSDFALSCPHHSATEPDHAPPCMHGSKQLREQAGLQTPHNNTRHPTQHAVRAAVSAGIQWSAGRQVTAARQAGGRAHLDGLPIHAVGHRMRVAHADAGHGPLAALHLERLLHHGAACTVDSGCGCGG